MEKLSDVEQKFKEEFFTTAVAMGTYGVDELGNAPIVKAEYYRTPNAMTFFYRQAIAELLEEVVGERVNIRERCGTTQCELFHDGYNQAKAEIRERIKLITE